MRFITLILILVSLSFLGCGGENNLPQARLEQAGVTCPINDDFKATLDNYFASHPNPKPSWEKYKRENRWHRAIVLKKNREFRECMSVSVLVYTERSGLRDLSNNSYYCDSKEMDLNTPVAGEIWFLDTGDNIISSGEVRLENERVVCIPDTLIFDEGKK